MADGHVECSPGKSERVVAPTGAAVTATHHRPAMKLLRAKDQWNCWRGACSPLPHLRGRVVCALASASLMQLRRLHEAIAVAGFDAGLDGLAIAIDRDRDFDPGSAQRPDLAIEPGELAHLRAPDRQQHVAGAQIRLLRRPILGEAHDYQLVLDCG